MIDVGRLKAIYDWPIALKGVFFAIIFSVVLYAGYWLDLSGFYDVLDAQKQKEIDLKHQLTSIFQKVAMAENDSAQLPLLKSNLEKLHTKIIHRSELPDILKAILKLGSTNHLYFSLFDPGDENVKTIYPSMPIKVIAIGTYHQISHFLSQVANMSAIIAIGPFNMSKEIQPDLAASNRVTTELLLEVYYLPENKKHEN